MYPGSFDPLTIAHLAIADKAVDEAALDRLDLALSRSALGKEGGAHLPLADRVAAIERAARARPWLGVTVADDQLISDIARGYDAVVMGADKWAQVVDLAFYGGSTEARDAALARLPRVAVAPRPPFEVPDGVVVLNVSHDASSTAVREGRADWMAPEALDFDRASGAWSDPERYDSWLRP